ncbi:hypothetical protein [Reyranella sp.]|uniref:hypothetical protein n=1 Tax=Reyranella sp. TaxID=1929291 RepID=UPI00273141D0|nr:hypothetical protein [Reyranella sp.]MDP2377769.1 hypothetical protein [Reyranella sp.]
MPLVAQATVVQISDAPALRRQLVSKLARLVAVHGPGGAINKFVQDAGTLSQAQRSLLLRIGAQLRFMTKRLILAFWLSWNQLGRGEPLSDIPRAFMASGGARDSADD